MRVACLGGGPAGLYFAISLKRRDPSHDVVVIERNRADDTFGWGVVLSDDTLANLAANDLESAEAIRSSFVYWDDIAVHYRGTVTRSTGHGFSGIGRKRLLNILQDRAQALGVTLKFQSEAHDICGLSRFRSGGRLRRRQLQGTVDIGGCVQAGYRGSRLQIYLVRHAAKI